MLKINLSVKPNLTNQVKFNLTFRSLVIILFFTVTHGFAQSSEAPDPYKVKPQIPTSPEASAIGKFGDIPVGLYTGVPNINIPLYVLKIKDFELPINLSYNSSGIKVEELATVTGLGWSINPGGAISTSVNGLKDDGDNGFINPSNGDDILAPFVLTSAHLDYDVFTNDGGPLYNWAKRVADGLVDSQPDLYYYSYPGGSGKFYFDQQRQIHPIPFSAAKFKHLSNGHFKITNENGNIYIFNVMESSISENNCGSPSINSTIFLSSIELPDGNRITFNYSPLDYSYKIQPPISRKRLVPGYYAPDPMDCNNNMNQTIVMNGVRLTSITSTIGHDIKFIYHNDRVDLPGTKSLDSITISNQNGTINSYAFNYGYFGSVGHADDQRLKLLSVTGLNGAKHSFIYNETINIPNRLSFAQDHWGYYNGKNNSTLLPIEPDYAFNTGANREVDSAFSQMAILKQINYPTGGSTKFNYEQNDYFFKGNENTYVPSSSGAYGQNYQSVSTSFTIPTNQTVITGEVNYNDGSGSNPGPILGEEPVDPDTRIEITGSNGFYQYYYNNLTQNGKIGIDLQPGTYTITITCNALANGAYCNVSYVTAIGNYVEKNKLIGGLRIKNIVNKASMDGINEIKQYLYRQEAYPEKSSGEVNFYPLYTTLSQRYFYGRAIDIPGYPDPDPIATCKNRFSNPKYANYWKQSANSVYPIGSIKGGSVAYTFVTELFGSLAENGKTESTFSFTPNSGGSLSSPLVPFTDNDWLNGHLEKEIQYRNNSGIFQPISKKQNFYSIQPESVFWNAHYSPSSYSDIASLRGRGVSVEYKRDEKVCGLVIYHAKFYINDFRYKSEWFRTDSSRTVQYYYNPSIDSLIINNQLEYNNPAHLLPTKSLVNTSTGTYFKSETKYPQDYLPNTSAAIDSLIARNRINTVIRQTTQNNTSISAAEYAYRNWDNKITEPEYIRSQVNEDAQEERVQYYNYDDRANPVSYGQSKGSKINYLWSYNKSFVIAEVRNAEYSTLIAALGGQEAVKTFANKPSPDKAEIDAFIAPLRNNTLYSEMSVSSFSHDPLVGVTSQTDSKGMTIYYVYDDAKRLKFIKDQDGNIVKTNDYNYKNN